MIDAVFITNARIVLPGTVIHHGSVLLAEGKVAAFDPFPDRLPENCEHFDADGALLTPGLIDIHTHAIQDCLYERDPDDLIRASSILPQYGTTCVLPTLYRVLSRPSLTRIEQLADALSAIDGAHMPGFHFEGPFLSLPGAGAATVDGDVSLLDELLAAARGRVKAMSVSPDCRNIVPIIERLYDAGIAVFLTHTRASVKETMAAIDAGARHATHFYNVFPTPSEVEPGVRPVGAVEAVLADQRCTVDFICDGIHVDPTAIRLAIAAKGWKGIAAISDGNVGAGCPDGVYPTDWGFPVKVRSGDAARICDTKHPLNGQLAGSSLTMNVVVSNLLQWLRIPEDQTWAMVTQNPATIAGLTDKGHLEVGAHADIAMWHMHGLQLQAVRTWIGGQVVFERCDALV